MSTATVPKAFRSPRADPIRWLAATAIGVTFSVVASLLLGAVLPVEFGWSVAAGLATGTVIAAAILRVETKRQWAAALAAVLGIQLFLGALIGLVPSS